jgi:hypothetical protein
MRIALAGTTPLRIVLLVRLWPGTLPCTVKALWPLIRKLKRVELISIDRPNQSKASGYNVYSQ